MFDYAAALVLWLLYVLAVTSYNHRRRRTYYRVITYLCAQRPEVAAQIEARPAPGWIYQGGAFRPSFEYARRHEPLDDPAGEELLAGYARLSLLGAGLMWLGFALLALVAVVFYGQMGGWF